VTAAHRSARCDGLRGKKKKKSAMALRRRRDFGWSTAFAGPRGIFDPRHPAICRSWIFWPRPFNCLPVDTPMVDAGPTPILPCRGRRAHVCLITASWRLWGGSGGVFVGRERLAWGADGERHRRQTKLIWVIASVTPHPALGAFVSLGRPGIRQSQKMSGYPICRRGGGRPAGRESPVF